METRADTSGGFRQPVPPELIEAMCRRAFGDDVQVVRAVEIGVGTYNDTYRLELAGREPVVLRVAPTRARQGRGDREAMRNEYAAAPWFAALGALAPRIVAADFTHQLVDRDYLFQSLLPGVPASEHLSSYDRSRHTAYYRQLGAVTRAIHDVPGERFGRIAGAGFATWSEALIELFTGVAADTADAGLDADDARRIIDAADEHRAALDEVTEPRLLHGDLWQLNILLDPDAAEPTITGILDFDNASWGDPMADYPVHRIRQQAGTEADAFWHTYGHPPDDPTSRLRQLFYQARNLLGVRLDIHRRGIDLTTVPPIHWDLSPVLAHLAA